MDGYNNNNNNNLGKRKVVDSVDIINKKQLKKDKEKVDKIIQSPKHHPKSLKEISANYICFVYDYIKEEHEWNEVERENKTLLIPTTLDTYVREIKNKNREEIIRRILSDDDEDDDVDNSRVLFLRPQLRTFCRSQ